MPTEIMHAVRMQPISELQHHSPAVSVRLLTKGPDYLRRQLEGAQRVTLSAVERLAADKAKYVKSPQVAYGRQEGSHSSRGSRDTRGSSGGSSTEGSSQGSSNRQSQQVETEQKSPYPASAPVRRGSSKRQLRPDSLVFYRQKSRAEGGLGAAEQARAGLVRRLFLGSLKEKTPMDSTPDVSNIQQPGKEEAEPRVKVTGLHRSQSDISSRYSRSFAEFDTFFKYCGLEPEVVNELGRESFTPAPEDLPDTAGQQHRIRSVSVATSESGFSRRSGEGSGLDLQEDERLSGQLAGGGGNSSTSVIERNARIIKWLYSCKRARETRGGSPDLP
ncbi:protein FAM110C [Bombina bombina]|uniref:protein FAM110C n=1 Tax=Bombina bombina TaxID=8345 RepID=UPI00235A72F7|nr:protein FAM110C [Bombina bombina]